MQFHTTDRMQHCHYTVTAISPLPGRQTSLQTSYTPGTYNITKAITPGGLHNSLKTFTDPLMSAHVHDWTERQKFQTKNEPSDAHASNLVYRTGIIYAQVFFVESVT